MKLINILKEITIKPNNKNRENILKNVLIYNKFNYNTEGYNKYRELKNKYFDKYGLPIINNNFPLSGLNHFYKEFKQLIKTYKYDLIDYESIEGNDEDNWDDHWDDFWDDINEITIKPNVDFYSMVSKMLDFNNNLAYYMLEQEYGSTVEDYCYDDFGYDEDEPEKVNQVKEFFNYFDSLTPEFIKSKIEIYRQPNEKIDISNYKYCEFIYEDNDDIYVILHNSPKSLIN